ncbi:unnamed protein product [Ambrosiozyma monospora]|uniref:Unnamed protein product n=1 Tax=Ambrosiozyma monospora TaxID=43982 RepID=A0A9W6Z420_AMBMO|nr:unnamed protein product [Ambrosiozyma monospora]
MFWSVIVSEWVQWRSLYELERVAISALYEIFFNKYTYSPETEEINTLIANLERLANVLDLEDEAHDPILKFIGTIFDFLTTAAEMKGFPESAEFDNDRVFYKLQVTSYLLNVDKPELMHSLINSMYESYIDKHDYTQAALALELLANTYSWDPNSYLPPCRAPRMPAQSEFKRKEYLYIQMARNFSRGNKVEQAIACYQILLDAYDRYSFDLDGLSHCHVEMSKCFRSLRNSGGGLEFDCSYFVVMFIGLGFPSSLRGKSFVYEGLPFEHISAIGDRLCRLHPGSRIVGSEADADTLLARSKTPVGKYLFVKSVSPLKPTTMMGNGNAGPAGASVPVMGRNVAFGRDYDVDDDEFGGLLQLSFIARQYKANKNLNTFTSRRRKPGASSRSSTSAANVANLWTEEVTYETEFTFPTLMNRSEIKSVQC